MRQFLRNQLNITQRIQFSFCLKFKPINSSQPKTPPHIGVGYFLKLVEQKKEAINISVLSSKLHAFGLSSKKTKQNPQKLLDNKTITIIGEEIKRQIDQTSYKDKTFLVSFIHDYPKLFNPSIQEVLLANIRSKILQDDFASECPQLDYLGLIFFLVKLKAYNINDSVWMKLVNSASQYQNEIKSHQLGLFLWSLSSLHQRSKSNTLNQAILQQWNRYQNEILVQITEMSVYTGSLIMQSLCTMQNFNDEIWSSLIKNFNTLYNKGSFDEYSITFSLWAIATYSKSCDHDLRNILDQSQIVQYVSSNVEKFNTRRLLMSLWSLQQLGYGDDKFWMSIYTNQIRLILNSTQMVGPNDIAVIVQILSKQQVLNDNDWQTCEQLLMKCLKTREHLEENQMNEKSLVNVIQAFSLHEKGSDKFWILIEDYLIQHFNSMQSKGLSIIAYSLIKQSNVQEKTMSWLIKNINQTLQQKKIQISQLAHILWSLTHLQQYFSELDQGALKNLITNEYLENVKPKDITQLMWSFGVLNISLDENTQQVLHDGILDSISQNQFNENDASQILQSIGNIFSNKDLLYSILNQLLGDDRVKLNLNGISSAIQYNINEDQFHQIIERLKQLKAISVNDSKFEHIINKLKQSEKQQKWYDEELMHILDNLLVNKI